MQSALRRRERRSLERATGYQAPANPTACLLPQYSKLPEIGACLTNRGGIKWIVDGHLRTRCVTKKPGDNSELEYPVIFAENLSPRLSEFLAEVSRCTPKIILPLDTMPSAFPSSSHDRAHCIDAWSHPEQILLFTDAENVSEVILAHELAHVWIDLVQDIEDHRVWQDEEDTNHYSQVQSLQSFVMDFAVDRVLEEKGFDTSEIKADWEIASMQLRAATAHGYTPPTKREAVFMSTHLACCLVEKTHPSLPALMGDLLPVVKRNLPEVFRMAESFAQTISDSFPTDRATGLRAVDEVLRVAFAFTDPGLDYEGQLIYVEPKIDWEMDKREDWLTGQSMRAKCEIGVAMARLGATSEDTPVLNRKNDLIELCCKRPDGTVTASLPLRHAVMPPNSQLARINRMIEEQRQATKRMEEMARTYHIPGRTPPQTSPPGAHEPAGPLGPQPPHIPGFPPRTYSAGFARWLTKVRLEEMLAGEHPYAYCGNNPTSRIDPMGLQAGDDDEIGVDRGDFDYACQSANNVAAYWWKHGRRCPPNEGICVKVGEETRRCCIDLDRDGSYHYVDVGFDKISCLIEGPEPSSCWWNRLFEPEPQDRWTPPFLSPNCKWRVLRGRRTGRPIPCKPKYYWPPVR